MGYGIVASSLRAVNWMSEARTATIYNVCQLTLSAITLIVRCVSCLSRK